MIILWMFLAAAAAPTATPASPEAALQRGNAYYFQGDHAKALDAYARAIRLSSATASAWLNGAVVLEELGQRKEAARWYARAAALSPQPEVWAALGWAQWRAGELERATTSFTQALARRPDEPYALLGLARVELDEGRASSALLHLQRASAAAPLLNIAAYYEGKAYELLGKPQKAADAYKRSVIGDSYFAEGRDALGRVNMRMRSYNEAWRQFSKILDQEPKNKKFRVLVEKLRPLLTKRPSQIRPVGLYQPIAHIAISEPGPLVPLIRVGLGTNPRGHPRPRQEVAIVVSTDFDALDAKTGKRVLSGEGGDAWKLRVKRVKGKKPQIALINSAGKAVALRANGVTIKPRALGEGVIALDASAGSSAGKLLRGRLEATLLHGQMRLVNIIDLENYTNGVVAAEMPIKSPLEALKAQAVVARTHALFIMKVTRRHRKDGYDVCDEQHCQVYAGARAESARSRDVVVGTRGRVVTYEGKLAHVIYSSNCGGHTQSGRDLVGWGDVPYWSGAADSPAPAAGQRSPWELRLWLNEWPSAFCKPSADVHASHFRWTRVMAWKDLEAKLERRLKIGRLKTLRALRRSPSGNINLLLVEGSQRRKRIDSEIDIRGLLGLGSLRSTQFVIDYEYGHNGKPVSVVFHGGGWGHGVGLCQSGAMGRADAGQTYEEIIKAYFKGVALGQMTY